MINTAKLKPGGQMRGLYRLQAQMHEAVWKFSGPMRLPDRLSISWRVIYSDLGGTTW